MIMTKLIIKSHVKKFEVGETIKFRDINCKVTRETAAVHLLEDIIHVDEE